MLALGIQSTLSLLVFKWRCSSSFSKTEGLLQTVYFRCPLKHAYGKYLRTAAANTVTMSCWGVPTCHGCMLLIIAKILIFSWAESTSSFCFWATPVPRPYNRPQYFASSIVSSKNNCRGEKKKREAQLNSSCSFLNWKAPSLNQGVCLKSATSRIQQGK